MRRSTRVLLVVAPTLIVVAFAGTIALLRHMGGDGGRSACPLPPGLEWQQNDASSFIARTDRVYPNIVAPQWADMMTTIDRVVCDERFVLLYCARRDVQGSRTRTFYSVLDKSTLVARDFESHLEADAFLVAAQSTLRTALFDR